MMFKWVDLEGPKSDYGTQKAGWMVGEITDSGANQVMLVCQRQNGLQTNVWLPVCEATATMLDEMAEAARAKLRKPGLAVQE